MDVDVADVAAVGREVAQLVIDVVLDDERHGDACGHQQHDGHEHSDEDLALSGHHQKHKRPHAAASPDNELAASLVPRRP
jgi:hypothetical protein